MAQKRVPDDQVFKEENAHCQGFPEGEENSETDQNKTINWVFLVICLNSQTDFRNKRVELLL